MVQGVIQQLHTQRRFDEQPHPRKGQSATEYADSIGQWFSTIYPLKHRKQFGQYFTPVEIARFMASMITPRSGRVRMFDPGAGCGVLSCAACEFLAEQELKPESIVLDVFETDPVCCKLLGHLLEYLSDRLETMGIDIAFSIHNEDFIMRFAEILQKEPRLFSSADKFPAYDVCISNPPYFKLAKSDPRSVASSCIVHGQPNIYTLFMAISAGMLVPGGELVFITPRSFASGRYFRVFREIFFEMMSPKRIHIFQSRKNAFQKDGVLQENIILNAQRRMDWQSVCPDRYVELSLSLGVDDIGSCAVTGKPASEIIAMGTKDKSLILPMTENEEAVLESVSSWPGSLAEYEMEVSTGPIVPFRAKEYLQKNSHPSKCVPLLWMQNIRPMEVIHPLYGIRKEQYFTVSEKTVKLLLPDKNLLLLRRFSAKEEPKRLIAAPYEGGMLHSEWIGLENHLNYIHRPGGVLSKEELWGLALLYNSSFLDTYFRIRNGNTQVSATEIRAIPLPPLETIVKLGGHTPVGIFSQSAVDELIRRICGI